MVDSWLALQQLRAAALASVEPLLTPDVVNRISLDHLLFGARVLMGVPWEGSGDDGAGGYARARSGGRIPVDLLAGAPTIPPLDNTLPRRPVVAVLDTGIAPHLWFGTSSQSTSPGSFVVLAGLQQAILAQEKVQQQLTPTQLLHSYWDKPTHTGSLIGELEECTGHGTFIAGIYRQLAPAAQLLMVRIMHADSVVYEADLTLALTTLAAQVQAAQPNGPVDQIIDVVSLSLGYYDESDPNAPPPLTGVTTAIDMLTGLGVLVVAAAGNHSTTRPFYPAALALPPGGNGSGLAVTSVGAFNPNRSKALFSNDGDWVTCWEVGAAMVSTFPTNAQGSETPPNSRRAHNPTGLPRRDGLDPDDFAAGFAVWDGTSFAAPVAGAYLANALILCGQKDSTIALTDNQQSAMVARAMAARLRLTSHEMTERTGDGGHGAQAER
jgi:hypothetical protein